MLTIFGLIFGKARQTRADMSLQTLSNSEITAEPEEKTSLRTSRLLSYLAGALVMYNIVITELIMLGKNHVPFGEDISTISQWGPLVGAFFAIFGALMKVFADRATSSTGDVEFPPRGSAL